MKKHYYACGNTGYGNQCLAFESIKDRNYFVAYCEKWSNRRPLTRKAAAKNHKYALITRCIGEIKLR